MKNYTFILISRIEFCYIQKDSIFISVVIKSFFFFFFVNVQYYEIENVGEDLQIKDIHKQNGFSIEFLEIREPEMDRLQKIKIKYC